ncbi:hypothetical protein [Haloferax volcanii]|uniref:hypothetical protein n=1 Tax=Haloferax volcanii TaxID=2246 RepID=UPI00249A7C83|nr:hypothetical protein [Haloferax alexandrinus]
MPGTDVLDDASADHEWFEAELVAQDQDAARVAVADIDDRRAHSLVNDLVDDDVVTPIPDERVLVHEPSDEAFDSILQLAVFHRGWTAARDADDGPTEDIECGGKRY